MDNNKKLNTGIDWKNKKYRPNVFFNKELQSQIESRFKSLGYKSFNEYCNAIIKKDIQSAPPDHK